MVPAVTFRIGWTGAAIITFNCQITVAMAALLTGHCREHNSTLISMCSDLLHEYMHAILHAERPQQNCGTQLRTARRQLGSHSYAGGQKEAATDAQIQFLPVEIEFARHGIEHDCSNPERSTSLLLVMQRKK